MTDPTLSDVNQMRADMIAQFRRAIATAEAELAKLSGVLLGQGWIVECQNVFLTFDTDGGVARNPRPASPHLCVRFTEQDARAVAKTVKNGNGTQGQVLHLREALERQIKDYQDGITMLEGLAKARTDA